MWSKIKASSIGAIGLSGLQASAVSQINNARILVAVREAEAKAIIERAENFESIAKALREEANDKYDEASRAGRWATKLERTLA